MPRAPLRTSTGIGAPAALLNASIVRTRSLVAPGCAAPAAAKTTSNASRGPARPEGDNKLART